MLQEVAIVAVLVGGLAYAMSIFWASPARRLEGLLRQLAEGQIPKSFLVGRGRWFNRMSRLIEDAARRQAELQRQIDEDSFNLRAILGSMVEGVMVVDVRHRIRLVNSEFLDLFGLAQSPLDRTVLQALRHAEIEMLIRQAVATGTRQSREIQVHDRRAGDHARRYFEVGAVPLKAADLKVNGVVAVFHDISRIRQLEEVRREFVANVSHELRTPLAIFRGYLETLLDNPDMPAVDRRRVLETLYRHSNRLNVLVDDLLMLTRMESRRIELQPVSLRLDAFLRQVIDDYRKKAGVEGVHFVLQIPPQIPPLEADPLRLEQVMFNLFDNAIVYSRSEKSIEVAAVCEGKRMVISVLDRGIGIPRADLPHIFERFYRVDKGRSRELGGTGLGLSIVKHIMQRHGGEVSAESEFGQWTKINLCFPLIPAGLQETDGLSPKALLEGHSQEAPASLAELTVGFANS